MDAATGPTRVQLHVEAAFVTIPPRNDRAGAAQTVECTLPGRADGTVSFELGCGPPRPRDIFGTLCALHAEGTAPPVSDACDPNPTPVPETVSVFDALGHTVQVVQCQPGCGTYPLATTDTAEHFQVQWRARDALSNTSPAFVTRFVIASRTGSMSCGGATRFYGSIEYNGLLP